MRLKFLLPLWPWRKVGLLKTGKMLTTGKAQWSLSLCKVWKQFIPWRPSKLKHWGFCYGWPARQPVQRYFTVHSFMWFVTQVKNRHAVNETKIFFFFLKTFMSKMGIVPIGNLGCFPTVKPVFLFRHIIAVGTQKESWFHSRNSAAMLNNTYTGMQNYFGDFRLYKLCFQHCTLTKKG